MLLDVHIERVLATTVARPLAQVGRITARRVSASDTIERIDRMRSAVLGACLFTSASNALTRRRVEPSTKILATLKVRALIVNGDYVGFGRDVDGSLFFIGPVDTPGGPHDDAHRLPGCFTG